MARPIPQKDPKAVAELVALAKEARARLPEDIQKIEEVIRQIDPIELLSQLTVLFQTHNSSEQPDRDKSAQWQVRIEWLTWLVFSRHLITPARPELIDDPYLDVLDRLLDDYFRDVTMALPDPVEGLSDEQDELRSTIQLEAIHVRGEGFLVQLEPMATELYSPHNEWCIANLGLTVEDALTVGKTVAQLFEEKLQSMSEARVRLKSELLQNPARTLTLDLPVVFRDPFVEKGIPTTGLSEFAEAAAQIWFFSRTPDVVGFTPEELHQRLEDQLSPERVDAFLRLMSRSSKDIQGEPDPLALGVPRI